MSDRFESRRKRLRKVLADRKVDALLVVGERNVSWLTGFTGDSTYLLVTPDEALLVSDFRYVTQVEEECPGIPAFIRPSTMKLPEAVRQAVEQLQIERLGIEGHRMTLETFRIIQEQLAGVHLDSIHWEIEELRAVKDREEIGEIREAVRLAEKGFDFLKAILTPQATERQLAHELEHALRGFGADGLSFPAIVAVGDRSALPHYRPGHRTIAESPILLVDWGARTESGYVSDLTRTLLTGPFSAKRKFEKVYRTVLEAQQRAIEGIRPGARCGDIDALARDHIRKSGFGKHFDHGLGHGIGLDVHELPSLRANSETILRAGMVVTVEPGIYLPGWGGVRIEDDVLVTRRGCEVLSGVPKEWDSVYV
jgi:Xaa-Pro aminopeptidase